jgi:hypothetical protein
MTEVLQLLWENNTAVGRIIILLIVILGSFGAACAFWHRRRYLSDELQWLENVRGRLQRSQAANQQPGSEESPLPATATPPMELHELAEGVPADSLVGDRLQTIARMKQARAKVNVDALQQSSILKESAQWTLSFPGYVVGLVMMLGLFGTFIGLSLMVVDIQHALPAGGAQADATQWAASVSSLGRILAGKKTAFSATLAGLFFSIVVSAFNFGLARAQSNVYGQLERFTAEELLPATIPAFDDETPWEKLSLQLGDSFEHLRELTAEQTRSADQMLAVEKTFGTIIGNIETLTQRAATAPLQAMTGEITNVITQVANVNGAVIGLTEKLPAIVNAFRQAQQSTLREIATAMQQQQAATDRLAHAIETSRSARFGLSVIAAGALAVIVVAMVLHRLG